MLRVVSQSCQAGNFLLIMKTSCYCIFCHNHPKFSQRYSLGVPVTGYSPLKYNPNSDHDSHKAEVDCLEPHSPSIENGTIDPDDYDFPVTAYGDGISQTGFYNNDLVLFACCVNEKHELIK